MTDVINLRLARKRKARTDKARKAAGNRARCGRTKAEKQCEILQRRLNESKLDGIRIDPPPVKTQP